MTSSTKITIPLYPGVKGSLLEAPWTRKGTEVTQPIHWIVPMEIQWPDGWNIFNISVVPKLHAYKGQIEFEIYDKYQLAQPKYMGRVKIDCDTDTYEIQLEQRYHCYRLTAVFILTHAPQEPNERLAFQAGVPYGDWRYKDQI